MATKLDKTIKREIEMDGQAYMVAAESDLLAGRDPRAALAGAERQFDEASRLDPAFSLAVQEKVRAVSLRLEAELAAGKSTEGSVEALFRALPALEERMGSGAWLVTYWRAKAHVLYNVFLCREFVSEDTTLTPSDNPDLTTRSGCADCHATLEPLSAHFSRIIESDWTYLPQASFPVKASTA